MSRYLALSIMTMVLSVAGSAVASVGEKTIDQDVDLVWSSSDGTRMEIYYSQRKDGAWLEPVRVTDDHYDNMYPVIDRDSSGRRWIFWSAYDNGSMELRYTSGDGGKWQASESLPTVERTNISPSVVVDREDRVWVAWSANDGQLDDIMFARLQDDAWSEPALVHEPNEDGDLLPVIELDEAGAVQVAWVRTREGKTLTLNSRWQEDGWSKPQMQPNNSGSSRDSSMGMLEIPPFATRSSMVFVRVY